MYIDPKQLSKKSELVGVLEHICQALELTDFQHSLAKDRYEAVGNWLAEADDPILKQVLIYPQGSVSLGTTVKPVSRVEHDVDLVCFAVGILPNLPPSTLKKVIGNRLRSNGRYAPILEEKPRCWRLNYAGEFHLDITPSIKNPHCSAGGELVPDKKLQEWKSSNPRGYKALFDRRAALQPRIGMRKVVTARDRAMEELVPFPEQTRLKGVLRRTVQIAKRHRDVYFENDVTGSAPISIIITTLAARSYEYCVQQFEYDTEFDLLSDIVRHMPSFIETRKAGGCIQWFVWNETTTGENFAEKWNASPQLAAAFFDWHALFLAQTEAMTNIVGLDTLAKSLSAGFGSSPVTMAFDRITKDVSAARNQGKLVLSPSVGLMGGAGGGTPVRRNTFFGAD